MPATPESLQLFVSSCQGLKDEKSDSQTFLNRFFQAFGYADAIAAGAVMEKRIKKGSKAGNMGFADLVWVPGNLPGVIIEMKKKGTDLRLHYAQALQYWTHHIPRSRYVVLCNFDEFWIYDFDIQVDTPVDVVRLDQFVDRASSAFAFMESSVRKPVFRNNQQEITEKAGKRMGELCQLLKARGRQSSFDDLAAQRMVLQCVLAMFAEDRSLLPKDMFVGCVQECLGGASSYDVLGGLFLAMNTPGVTPAGRYKDVEYFNGGLFERVHPIELTLQELKILEVAALEDWSRVRPAIFGSIFEGTASAVERHKHGMHYTSEVDIMKIVRPTISRFWEERIEAAGTIGELNQLQLELQNYRVLDPACGSGNFLYLAYLELKRLERVLLDKITSRRKGSSEQMAMGFVTPLQFFGIDLNPFAVELARVTLMIARKIAIDNFGILDQPALPLDSLDQNIVCADALFTEWPKADAIVGNPPFLGGKHMRMNLGDRYIDKVFKRFPEVKDSVDFCAYWFRLAQDNLDQSGHAGLVATNSISQGKSRVASLDYVVGTGGVIHDAISSQVWSGEANVHVSLVNWVKLGGDSLRDSKAERSSLGDLPSSPALLPEGEGGRKGEGRRKGGEIDEELSGVIGRMREIPRELLERARELRKRQTAAEVVLWECLRAKRLMGAKFRRQHNIGRFIADFYCHEARLVVEADGKIHDSQIEQDADRNEWMESQGLTVLRFTNDQIMDDLEVVLSSIAQALPSPLAPLPEGEGDMSRTKKKLLLPSPSGGRAGDEGEVSTSHQPMRYYLDNELVTQINSSLKSEIDVSQAIRLSANLNKCFQGVIPVGKGFIVTEEQVNQWIKADPKNQEVLKLFSMGANLAQEVDGKPDRWVIDFNDMTLEDASDYKLPFQHVKTFVKPDRDSNRRGVTRLNWWKYGEKRPAMRKAIGPLQQSFAVPRVSKWSVFLPFPSNWLAGDLNIVCATDDFYVLGILTSNVHRTWVKAQSSTLEDRTRYTHNTCFETFPFPQYTLPSPLTPLP